jgi:hypothetical protein
LLLCYHRYPSLLDLLLLLLLLGRLHFHSGTARDTGMVS